MLIVKHLHQGIHLAHCKNQLPIQYRQSIKVKSGRDWRIVLPLFAKYNQRKLMRIARFAQNMAGLSFFEVIKNLLEVENYLDVLALVYFFDISRAAAEEILIKMECANLLKILSLNQLEVTSRAHCLEMLSAMQAEISRLAAQRTKTGKITDLEKSIKLPHTSIFFRYLLHSLQQNNGFSRQGNMIVFHKVAPAPDVIETIPIIEKTLKKNKLIVFTINDIIKLCDLNYKTVNDALWHLVESERVLPLNDSSFAFSEEIAKIINRLKKFKRNQGDLIDIQSFRDISTCNRKTIITILEYLDSQNITQRSGAKRRILLPA